MSFEGHVAPPWTLGKNRSTNIAITAPRRLVYPDYRFGTGDEAEAVAVCRGPLRKANGRLIAAAPELLRQRDALAEVLREVLHAEALHVAACDHEWSVMVEKMRAALAACEKGE